MSYTRQQQLIENLNYFDDLRTGDPAPDKIVVTIWDEDGGETDHEMPSKFEICHVCRGEGKHVNPSIDCGGLTQEDFAEDPDFAEDYMSGVYDVPCNNCRGLRVEKVVDWDRVPKDLADAYREQEAEKARWRAEERRELMMGC